ncbi:hypothetical protein D3C79_853600 [compost metagenome]
MADTAHGDQLFGFADGVFKVFGAIHCQCRREFLVSERFGFINQFHFTDQHLGACRHFNTGHFGNFRCRLTHDGRVQPAVFQNDVLDRFQLFALQQVAAMGSETFTHCIVDGVYDDDRLLGGANDTAVEGFGHQDRSNDAFDIRRFVNHHRGVTGTDADGRLAGAVGGFHHARAAGSEDQVDVRVVH